ncbi:MAG: protein-methionine-sulfoxide reductase catalytic subunit MsrP [Cyanobacteria bacterium P01_E01_bin.34]
MPVIRIPKLWELPEQRATSESAYIGRRKFMLQAAGARFGIGAASAGCYREVSIKSQSLPPTELPATLNPAFSGDGLVMTQEEVAARYNNFYEFGGSKNIWRQAQALPTDPWTLEVTGLVRNPTTYDLDDLTSKFPLEERVYRFRCVEAWAMVVPWLGFPMHQLMTDVEPTPDAKYVRFESFYDPDITTGPTFPRPSALPWPYQEALRIDEMANELAFFAVGIYGQSLPKQHGAPIRMVVPWKYGFKGAKSIVKIEFMADRPATYWNSLAPDEYGFLSNVEPDVPHPRWSQAEERLIADGPSWSWTRQPTLPYNGYEAFVGHLYA